MPSTITVCNLGSEILFVRCNTFCELYSLNCISMASTLRVLVIMDHGYILWSPDFSDFFNYIL